ncbi:MAG: acyl-CoA dehydrogenase family protein [Alphaproteobacteria bacterium]
MRFSAEDQAFREEVRRFIRENLPDDIRRKVLSGMEVAKDDYMRWHRILHGRGWVAPNWPQEWGGPGWNVVQRYIFDDEAGLAGAPRLSPFGIGMIGPVLMAFGTEAQKREHLPRILSGDEVWCQGYSEPGSGSDLASLKTRAERVGDQYVINGSKLWTSLAHHADWIFCLVRTSQEPKRQDGISFLVFPVTLPGIEIRPVITMNGLRHVNEVFFTDVTVPLDALVGEEGKGWTIAKYLLQHERFSGGAVGELKTALQRVKEIAARETSDGTPLMADAAFRRKIAETEVELEAVELTTMRALAAHTADKEVGAVSSLIKIRRTEVQQMISELGVQAAGYYALPHNIGALRNGWNEEPVGSEEFNALVPNYLFLRAASIYSGSNEIQRNIISKAELGL